MNKKKILVSVLAVALICAIAIAGTLAFLTASTEEGVVNTFVAAPGLIDPPQEPAPEDPYDDNGLFVLENEVTLEEDGSYTIADNAELALGNDYTVLPEVNLPKNPFVRLTGKTTVPAYLYIEVVDTLGEDSGLSYEIAEEWVLLENAVGSNGGDIYVYSDEQGDPVILTADIGEDVAILVDDQIVVGDTLSIPDGAELSFYGYLAQASAGEDATSAFGACFPASDPEPVPQP